MWLTTTRHSMGRREQVQWEPSDETRLRRWSSAARHEGPRRPASLPRGVSGAALRGRARRAKPLAQRAQPGGLRADPPCLARGSQDTVPTQPTAPATTSHSGVKLGRRRSPAQHSRPTKRLLKAPNTLSLMMLS